MKVWVWELAAAAKSIEPFPHTPPYIGIPNVLLIMSLISNQNSHLIWILFELDTHPL